MILRVSLAPYSSSSCALTNIKPKLFRDMTEEMCQDAVPDNHKFVAFLSDSGECQSNVFAAVTDGSVTVANIIYLQTIRSSH